MARVVKSEVNAAVSSSLMLALINDALDAYKLKLALSNFVENSGRKLSGPNYDEAREVASQYIPILEKRAKRALELVSTIKSSCNSMSDYMGRFAVLDDSERATYESNLKNAQSKLNALDSINWTDEEFNLVNYWYTYFSAKRIIKECSEYIEKLDGLKGVDASLFGAIEAASSGDTV